MLDMRRARWPQQESNVTSQKGHEANWDDRTRQYSSAFGRHSIFGGWVYIDLKQIEIWHLKDVNGVYL